MNKIYYIIIGGVLLLGTSSFALWKINSKKNENSSEQPTSVIEQPNYDQEKSNEETKNQEKKKFPVKAEIKSLTYSETWDTSPECKALDIKIDYLVIENKNNSKEIDNLNKYLEKEAQKRFSEVKKDLKEYLKAYKENEKECKREVNCNPVFVCEDTSEITKNNENGIISVNSYCYWDAGGPHPDYVSASFVLDCNTGKKLGVFDVIQGDEMKIRSMIGKEIDKSDWAKEIREAGREIGQPIEGPYFSDMFIINGFGDKGDSLYDLNNQPFHLKDKCLVIDFSRGDIGGNALGAPSFDFSYDTIRKYGFSVGSKFD